MLWGVWELPHASHLPAQKSDAPSLQKAGPGGPLLLGSQENSQIMPGWHPGWRSNPSQERYGQVHCGKVFSEVKAHGAMTKDKSKSPVLGNRDK